MKHLLGFNGLLIATATTLLAAGSGCSDDDEPEAAAGRGGSAGRGRSTTGGSAGEQPASGGASGDGGSGGGGAGTAGGAGSSGAPGLGGGAGAGPDDPLTRLRTLTPLPAVPPDPTNRVADDAAAAALGQRLFFDQAFSGPLAVDSDLGSAGQTGRVSCASCHSSEYLDDARSMPETVSLGANFHSRNSPTLVNASFYRWTNWGGRFAAQWELPLAVVENGVIMNGNRLKVAHRIFDVYRTEYEAIFGALDPTIATFPANGKPKPAPTDAAPNPPDGPWELELNDAQRSIVDGVLANYSKAIAAYLRLLVSRDAPFDRWMAGDDAAITDAAKRGAALFVGKARCVACHTGPHFSDGGFHNIGVPQTGERVPASDDGRFRDGPPLLASKFNVNGAHSDDTTTNRLPGVTNPMPENTRSAFRTPGLRGVALTAPFMHAGQLATLLDVVEFYDRGGDTPASGTKHPLMQIPLGLSSEEKADLVSFLESLTGAPIPASLLVDDTP